MQRKILVIDDNIELLDVIKFLLEQEGFNVDISTDPKILSDLSCVKPNLILLNDALYTGKMNDVCLNIKTNIHTANTSIIISSLESNIGEIARSAKADGYIKKPFEILELVDIVKNTMQINNNFEK